MSEYNRGVLDIDYTNMQSINLLTLSRAVDTPVTQTSEVR